MHELQAQKKRNSQEFLCGEAAAMHLHVGVWLQGAQA
jgi:hypothetical protein